MEHTTALVLQNLPGQPGEILAINSSGTFAVVLEYYAQPKLSNVHVVVFLMFRSERVST